VRLAQQNCDEVVVSVFVNPKQFAPSEDLDRYPRQEAMDIEICEAAGVDVFFAPSAEEMYPHGMDAATIHIGGVGDNWEGSYRPGHFDGVATIVSKLCHIVAPRALFMGQKDLQQCAIVARMIEAINEPYDLVIGPTLREKDGLAMSSRNAYLTGSEREIAPRLSSTLHEIRTKLLENNDPTETIEGATEKLRKDFDVQYLALVDKMTLEERKGIDKDSALIVAAYLGTTRLIDNLLIY
jgi:pantoate--beta-alanine ligase